jgi:hypothetical protein
MAAQSFSPAASIALPRFSETGQFEGGQSALAGIIGPREFIGLGEDVSESANAGPPG